MKRNIIIVFSSLLTLFSIVSCKKGDTGPQGPGGPQGAAGAQGVQGSQGPTGTANVKYSAWFTANPWIKDTVFDIWEFNYNMAATDITQQVLDSGTVLTFGKLAGYNTLIWPTGQVAQMPITVSYKFSSGGITYNDTWSALATVGNLRIRFIDDQNYYGSIATSHQFRYIIIPGGVSDGRIAQLSYHELCKQYNIPE